MESKAKVIYFYKADEHYGCFSNFSPHPIYCQGEHWATVEHFYQAHKFISTPDEVIIPKIRQAPTPKEAAAIGRDPQYSLRHDWDHVKQMVMWEGVLTKFKTHPDIAKILLDTGTAELIEDSPIDYYWGCGANRTGYNHLGKILMRVRNLLSSTSNS